MKKLALVAVVAAILGGGFWVSRGWADGIATEPLFYSGFLQEDGAPIGGTRNLELDVWDDAADTAQAHLVCSTRRDDVAIEGGRFRIALDPGCAEAVHAHPDLWVELRVEQESLGRTKIGAVPFAVESARASEASGALRARLDTLVPPGSVIAFAGGVAPEGWLPCDGAEVDRNQYAALFAAIGTAHGGGNGSTSFRLPDYRGRFLRGVDAGAGHDPEAAQRAAAAEGGVAGDAVGSVQGFATARPTTGLSTETAGNHTHAVRTNNSGIFNGDGYVHALAFSLDGSTPEAGDHTHNITGGDAETRPVNAGVSWIIKY